MKPNHDGGRPPNPGMLINMLRVIKARCTKTAEPAVPKPHATPIRRKGCAKATPHPQTSSEAVEDWENEGNPN